MTSDIQVLWSNNWWDGPLEGVCVVKDKVHYFKLRDWLDDGDPIYNIYEMSDKEFRDEYERHILFLRLVGNSNHDFKATQQPKESMNKFYDYQAKNPLKREFLDSEPVFHTAL